MVVLVLGTYRSSGGVFRDRDPYIDGFRDREVMVMILGT